MSRSISRPSAASPDAPRAAPSTPHHAVPPPAARVLISLLGRLSEGALTLTTPDARRLRFGAPHVKAASLVVHDWRMAARALRGGDVGFAESYMDGEWDTPDLVGLLTLLAANQASLTRAFYGRWWVRAALRMRHFLRRNSRQGARRNIVAHYDLGNAFYALWLDPTMTYSSALFDGDYRQPLASAQHAKYRSLLDALELRPDSRILEIGSGWGFFAEIAARAGHRVTGISLSDAQTSYARARLADAGFADRVDLRIEDYRDVRGRFGGVASIEMIEAVGERWWPAYFAALRRVLVPDGRAAIQAITIANDRFERYRTQSDFIQQYIFPGGMLPSPARLVQEAAAQGLRLVASRTFGLDYAETLRRWLAAFDAHVDDVRAQGFDERFVRCWRFYLAYCAAGFATSTTDVGQYVFARDR
jgi:cyclopropane-fatty-acyl-phospholipid synthase